MALLRRIVRWMEMAEISFADFRWFRRLHGGHWELWYVSDGQCRMWLHVGRCFAGSYRRPLGLFGTPQCEDWG